MWLPGAPDPEEMLRQGDLLNDVPFPILSREPAIPEAGWTVRYKRYPAIVVSQCCTTQQRKVAELAAVVRTKSLTPEHPMVRGLISGWPAKAGDVFYDGMFLETVGDVVPPIQDGRYPHAAFKSRVTYTEDLEWLQHKRVARMTPEARRDLRLRLGAWYARTEDSDREHLEGAGLFTGLHDQPEDARQG